MTDQMWRTHHAKILLYIRRRVNDPHLAEDLAAETFTRALAAQARGHAAPRKPIRWLYRIAHNLVVDHYRARERRPAYVALCLAAPRLVVEDQALDIAVNAERRAWLQFALPYLTQQDQTVIALRLQGYPFSDIAAEIGLSTGAVKAAYHRGKTRLQEVLKGWTA